MNQLLSTFMYKSTKWHPGASQSCFQSREKPSDPSRPSTGEKSRCIWTCYCLLDEVQREKSSCPNSIFYLRPYWGISLKCRENVRVPIHQRTWPTETQDQFTDHGTASRYIFFKQTYIFFSTREKSNSKEGQRPSPQCRPTSLHKSYG